MNVYKIFAGAGCDSSGDSARWCVDFLKTVMAQTPHTWANHTLQCLPPVIAEFYHQCAAPRENMHTLKVGKEESAFTVLPLKLCSVQELIPEVWS